MYITVLDFREGTVHQYQMQPDKWITMGGVEEFLVRKGHVLKDCEWMSRSGSEIIIDYEHEIKKDE